MAKLPELEEKIFERPATPHARKQCSQCALDCTCKNMKGTCLQFIKREKQDG